MKITDGRIFLYSGLILLFIAFVVKWLGMPLLFWILLFPAISLKALFLIMILRARNFKPSVWLYLILIGVVMIFASLLFKTVFPNPVIRNILFYGATSLKTTGLVLMLLEKKKSKTNDGSA